MVRLTPNGLSVSERQRAISLVRSSGVGCVSAVMKPSAPALATAATSSARPTHCMPPCTIGCSTPTSSVNRVLIIMALWIVFRVVWADCRLAPQMSTLAADLKSPPDRCRERSMRILIVGAGAMGGYFGACLVHAGRDVTFMARPQRAAQLGREGLRISSPHGDFAVPAVAVPARDISEPFELVLVTVKSYSLDEAMEQFAPAVGPNTAILPILNGMGHLDRLGARFGANRALGGRAKTRAGVGAGGR